MHVLCFFFFFFYLKLKKKNIWKWRWVFTKLTQMGKKTPQNKNKSYPLCSPSQGKPPSWPPSKYLCLANCWVPSTHLSLRKCTLLFSPIQGSGTLLGKMLLKCVTPGSWTPNLLAWGPQAFLLFAWREPTPPGHLPLPTSWHHFLGVTTQLSIISWMLRKVNRSATLTSHSWIRGYLGREAGPPKIGAWVII